MGFKAAPHKERLTALHQICLRIFRTIFVRCCHKKYNARIFGKKCVNTCEKDIDLFKNRY